MRKHVFLHVAIASCDAMIGRHNSLAQKLEAEIVRIVSVHCHVHHLASACCYVSADLCSVRKCESTLMRLWKCFTVAIGLPGNASDYNEDEMSAFAARMQNKVVVEWGNCAELGVRFWPFGLHWSSCEHAQIGGGHEGPVPLRYNMPWPPQIFSRFRNILVSHQAVPSRFTKKLRPWLWATKNDAMGIVWPRLVKTKKFIMVLSFS